MPPIIKNKIHLKIDYREKRSGILKELDKYSDLFECEVCTLLTGDYHIDDKIIIERKTLPAGRQAWPILLYQPKRVEYSNKHTIGWDPEDATFSF